MAFQNLGEDINQYIMLRYQRIVTNSAAELRPAKIFICNLFKERNMTLQNCSDFIQERYGHQIDVWRVNRKKGKRVKRYFTCFAYKIWFYECQRAKIFLDIRSDGDEGEDNDNEIQPQPQPPRYTILPLPLPLAPPNPNLHPISLINPNNCGFTYTASN
jgi:hypothetical protein